MSAMFKGATDFNQDLGGWNVVNVTGMSHMLDNTDMGGASYENTLIGWNGKTLQRKVTLGASGLTYGCAADAARANLVDFAGHDWTINGDISTCRPANNSLIAKPLKVYPNPSKDRVYINLINAGYKNASISILDMSGRVVLRDTNKEVLDVSHLRNGVYLIEILHEKRRQVFRFIKE